MSTVYSVHLLHNWQTRAGPGWSGGTGVFKRPLADRLYEVTDVSFCDVVGVRNADDRLYVFVTIGTNGAPPFTYHCWQKVPTTDQTLGGDWDVAYAAIAGHSYAAGINILGCMVTFCIDSHNNIQHAWQLKQAKGPWQAKPFGASAKRLSTVGYGGRVNLFAIGLDDRITHYWQTTDDFEHWENSTFELTAKRIAATLNADGRIEVAFVGLDDKLYSISQPAPGVQGGTWHFAPLVGQAKEIAVGRNADGRLEVVYIGMDDGIYHTWQTKPSAGPWAGSGLGGLARQLRLAQNLDGRLEYFYIGSDWKLYHNWQTSPNGDWIGNDPQLDPTLGNREPLCVEAMWTGRGINVFHPTAIPSQNDPDGPGNDDGGGGPVDLPQGGGDVDQPDSPS